MRREARRFRAAVLLVGPMLTGCAAREPAPDAGAVHPATRALPPGAGRAILARACVDCHNLEGLAAYKGYYDAARWRGLVETMIAHGAQLNETELTELVEYLAEHFGPGSP